MLEPLFDLFAIVFATPKKRAKVKRAIVRREESRARSAEYMAEYRKNKDKIRRQYAFDIARRGY